MNYLELFISFVKIGFTSFGGMSMIPLINNEMLSHGWMSAAEVVDIVAIAEMTPGPLGINCATFAGIRTAGVLGAVTAVSGLLVPNLTLCALVAVCFERFQDSAAMRHIMTGIRPAAIGMIVAVTIAMATTNYVIDSALSLSALAIGILDTVLLLRFKMSIPLVILISAVLGLMLF